MRVRIILVIAACFVGLTRYGYAQTETLTAYVSESADISGQQGVWDFHHAEWIAFPLGKTSRQVVETQTVSNAEMLPEAGMHFENVIVKIEISGGQVFCTLRNGLTYRLENNYLIPFGDKKKVTDDMNEEVVDPLSETLEIPLISHTLQFQGDQLVFTNSYSFGDSRYRETLTGVLTITLNKQKQNER
jgi:hypothetical protein